MSQIALMVIDDPSKMHLLTTQMKKQVIHAAISTVNIQAAMTRKNAQTNIAQNFLLRNTFTSRNITFTPCPSGSVHTLNGVQSSIGSTEKAGYMERQEKGGEHTSPAGHLSIPTDEARGGSKKNPVMGMYRAKNLKNRIVRGQMHVNASSPSRQVARAAVAFKRNKLVRYGGNLFKVTTFWTNHDAVKFTMKEIYTMRFASTHTKESPWLQPAAEKPAADCQAIFNAQMDKAGKL
jgi:hypothetical protein